MFRLFELVLGAVRRRLRSPRVFWHSNTDTCQTTIEIQHGLLPFVVLVVVFWYLVAPSGVITVTLFTLAGVLLADFLWALAMARGVTAQRRLRYFAMQVGDELEEEITLQNRSLLPVLWAEFLDHSDIPGYTVSSVRAANAVGVTHWRAHTICSRRGVFSLGPWELRLGQPFGVFLVRQVYLQRQEILVYPPMAVLPETVLPHRGALGDSRPLNQPLLAETISSSSVRAYLPGDPLRHIHWRTTARRVDPYVKVFTPEAASNIWLMPDFDADVHLEQDGVSSQETMVTVTASLAAELLRQNLSVGLVTSADQEVVLLPRQGQPYLWTLLQALAPLHAVPQRPIEGLLQRARALLSGSDLLILITPSLRPDWVAALKRIAQSRGGSSRAEVILIDTTSLGGQTSPQAFLQLLVEQGIPASILRPEDIHLISGYYGEVRRWEFTVFGTGRAVLRRAPRSAVQTSVNDSQSAGR